MTVNASEQIDLTVLGEDISLNLVTEGPLGSVKADLGQIEQVLMNLAVNARDAMPRGGKISIQTANVTLDEPYAFHLDRPMLPGNYVVLSFSDTGCGMDNATKARIFEPFFTTKDLNGTGLGLWISAGIVERHQGRLRVRSSDKPTRHGTVFTLFLPCKEVE